jgi:adenylate kinase
VLLVMLGAPGVGKGTQGRRLAAVCGCALISTGEILREAVARGTPLGIEAQRQMDSGQLVDDEVMIGLVRERTGEPDAREGFVLDGFPRTVPQAEALDAMLAARGQQIDMVLSITANEDELIRRLQGRRECPVCKRAYHPEGAPARDGRHCDDHPFAELLLRQDDSEEVVRHRFAEFRAKTAPLVDYYTVTGRLRPVSGTGTVDEVFETLRREAGCSSRTPQTN